MTEICYVHNSLRSTSWSLLGFILTFALSKWLVWHSIVPQQILPPIDDLNFGLILMFQRSERTIQIGIPVPISCRIRTLLYCMWHYALQMTTIHDNYMIT